jgi:hypothetical protein
MFLLMAKVIKINNKGINKKHQRQGTGQFLSTIEFIILFVF